MAGLNGSAVSCIRSLAFYGAAWVVRSVGSPEIQGFALGGRCLCCVAGGAQATRGLEPLITERRLCLAGGVCVCVCEKPPLKGSSSFSPALEGAAVHFDEGKAPKL